MAHKPLFEPSDLSTVYPLVSMLPARGSALKLRGLTSSLFARHERVRQLIDEPERGEVSPEARRRYLVEEAMLRQALEWLGADVVSGL